MGIRDCCDALFAGLPNPSLPLLPSLALGVLFSALIMMAVFRKQHNNMPVRLVLADLLRRIFCLFPFHDHAESQGCKNPSCVRCIKYKEMEEKVAERWWSLEKRDGVTKRLEDSVAKMIGEDDWEDESDEESDDDGNQVTRRKNKDGEKMTDGKGKRRNEDEEDKNVTKEGNKSKNKNALQKPTIFHMDLAAHPFWNDFDVFGPELGLLKVNFDVIHREFEQVFASLKNGDHWGWKNNAVPQGHWCIFPLIDQGQVNEANCRRCPNTAAMVGSMPSLMRDCVFGNVCFSLLYPDSTIEPHCGPTNLRLRCHLGLQVPGPAHLEVAGTQVRWRPRETILFDDSFSHSAAFPDAHHSRHPQPRAVLMMDLWHPDVTPGEKQVLTHLLSP